MDWEKSDKPTRLWKGHRYRYRKNEIKLHTEISAITARHGSNLRKGDAAGAWKWQSDVIYVVLYLDLFTCRMLCAFHFETILWHSLRFTIHVPDRFARFCRLRTLHLSRSRTKAATWIETAPKSWKIAQKPPLLYTTLQYVWIIFNFTGDLCLSHMIFRCAPCRSRLKLYLEKFSWTLHSSSRRDSSVPRSSSKDTTRPRASAVSLSACKHRLSFSSTCAKWQLQLL